MLIIRVSTLLLGFLALVAILSSWSEVEAAKPSLCNTFTGCGHLSRSLRLKDIDDDKTSDSIKVNDGAKSHSDHRDDEEDSNDKEDKKKEDKPKKDDKKGDKDHEKDHDKDEDSDDD